jgi:hypothetical protein
MNLPFTVKNIAPRPYGVNGKIIAPLGKFDVTDEVTLASVEMHIGKALEIVASDDAKESTDAPAKRGRKPKESTDAQEGGAE